MHVRRLLGVARLIERHDEPCRFVAEHDTCRSSVRVGPGAEILELAGGDEWRRAGRRPTGMSASSVNVQVATSSSALLDRHWHSGRG